MSRTPRTDALVHQLSQANYGESKMERACRVENPLMALCRQLESELATVEHCLKVERDEVKRYKDMYRELTKHQSAGRWL